MATSYNSWKVERLRNHLQQRALNVSRYRKEDLIKLCEMMDQFHLRPQPSVEEESAMRATRLKEILTPSRKCNLPDPSSSEVEWSVSFSDIPDMNLMHIYSYFIQSPNPVYWMEHIKAYKAMAAYSEAVAGFVQDWSVSKDLPENWMFIKGVVSASLTAAKTYDVWALINGKSEIRACHCDCKVGMDEFCSHAACLLFYILIINETGLNQKLCTEDVCAWNHLPSKKDSSSRVLVAECVSEKERVPDFAGKFNSSTPGTTQEFMNLIMDIAPDSAVVQARIPQPHEPQPSFPVEAVSASGTPLLPLPPAMLAASFLDSQGQSAVEPLRFAAIVKHCITEEQSVALEEFTKEQGEVGEWSSHRWGRITASKAHSVRTFMGPLGGFLRRATPVSALKQICPRSDGVHLRQRKAIRFGIQNEQRAADAYVKAFGPKHGGKLILERMGLKVPVDDAHIGVSIDRLAKCTCGKSWCKKEWIVEIKCPFSVRHMEARSFEAAEKLSYLQCTLTGVGFLDYEIQLRERSSYYTQLQMQMGVTGVHKGELFIWTVKVDKQERELEEWWFSPIDVKFKKPFWKQLKAKLDVFYQEYVAELILTFGVDVAADID